MLDATDFSKKQILFLFTSKGDKLAFQNDNVVIRDSDGKIKHQSTCYRLFVLFVVGETSVTSGLIRRAKKFGFTICMMTQSMKLYEVIGTRMEGNTELRKRQYQYEGLELAKLITINKIQNQRRALNTFRKKTEIIKDAIKKLDQHIIKLKEEDLCDAALLGIEGSAARTYFPQMFNNVEWKGRKPRIKFDFINTTLDIGYNLLFNLVDSLLQVYGFDVYYGVLHKSFYMRKSLVCDIMEPFRPIIDLQVRKAINLGQCKQEDFEYRNNQWILNYKKSAEYVSFLMQALLEHKHEMFLYIQGYYRHFMKKKTAEEFPIFELR